jgi:DNA-binding response OmpR family regulator
MSHKILVIEDDIEMLTFLGILLRTAGFEVLQASFAAEGLKLARQRQPSLVLLDIMLPDMDGWVVCERLRQIGPMPIVFVTALRDSQNQSKGLAMGDDYIVKPFDPRELVRRVREQIERSVDSTAAAPSAADRPDGAGPQ